MRDLGRAEFGCIRQQLFQHLRDCRPIGVNQRRIDNTLEDDHPISTGVAPAEFRDSGLSGLTQIDFFENRREPLGFQFSYGHHIAENS